MSNEDLLLFPKIEVDKEVRFDMYIARPKMTLSEHVFPQIYTVHIIYCTCTSETSNENQTVRFLNLSYPSDAVGQIICTPTKNAEI